jgi:hypothetical protein
LKFVCAWTNTDEIIRLRRDNNESVPNVGEEKIKITVYSLNDSIQGKQCM